MDLVRACTVEDADVIVILVDGRRLHGRLLGADAAWLLLQPEQGRILLPVAQVQAVLAAGAELPNAVGGRGRRRAAAGPGATQPPADVSDEDLRRFADAFLDGLSDADIAASHGRSRSLIRILHMAFEGIRCNCDEDDLPPAAQAWIGRFRSVLAG
ncbi:MAG: hypothetical protein ACOCXA_03265 [Planctomycetota bacterium]